MAIGINTGIIEEYVLEEDAEAEEAARSTFKYILPSKQLQHNLFRNITADFTPDLEMIDDVLAHCLISIDNFLVPSDAGDLAPLKYDRDFKPERKLELITKHLTIGQRSEIAGHVLNAMAASQELAKN